ncbi:MAG: hypothetical protein CVT95_09860 [Bacteroidetes bacterium HGW-Bacteroidetes-12]|nr:MAG: hypothetical protein CVT95_09860 [Bacteroidetes bacterium HGW-Bacteroidetes-12]
MTREFSVANHPIKTHIILHFPISQSVNQSISQPCLALSADRQAVGRSSNQSFFNMLIVITINYNLHQHTIPCVNSVLESDYKNFKVFLVDNGSRADDYNELVKKFSHDNRVSILRIEKNRGYVGGVNFGLEAAKEHNPNYFMVMNNDTIIDKFAISELVAAAKRYSNRAIVSGKVYYHDHPDVLQHTGVVFSDPRYCATTYPGRNEKDIGQHDIELERDSLDDVFWLIPSDVFNEVGYYSHFFYLYAEQGDYAQRARRLGFKLIYNPKAKLWHKESLTTGGGNPKALPIQYWTGKSYVVFIVRNLKFKYFIKALLVRYFKTTYRLFFGDVINRKAAFAHLRGVNSGIAWIFHRKPDTGYNPYIKR